MDDNPYKAPQTGSTKPLQKRVVFATVLVIVLFGLGFYLRGLPLFRFLWP
jgi:hypothetical protein